MEPQAGKAAECSKLSGLYCKSWTVSVEGNTVDGGLACGFSEGSKDSLGHLSSPPTPQSIDSGQLGLTIPLDKRSSSLQQNLLGGIPQNQKLWSGGEAARLSIRLVVNLGKSGSQAADRCRCSAILFHFAELAGWCCSCSGGLPSLGKPLCKCPKAQ